MTSLKSLQGGPYSAGGPLSPPGGPQRPRHQRCPATSQSRPKMAARSPKSSLGHFGGAPESSTLASRHCEAAPVNPVAGLPLGAREAGRSDLKHPPRYSNPGASLHGPSQPAMRRRLAPLRYDDDNDDADDGRRVACRTGSGLA